MQMIYTEVTTTPTLDTSAYSSGDRLGTIITLEDIAFTGPVKLKEIVVLDKDKQSLALDVLFFNALPTVASADNAAIDISDAEMAKCIGSVSLVAGDYCLVANSSVATKRSIDLMLQPEKGTNKLYAVLVSRAAPTYTAAGLVFRLKFER